MGGGSIIILNTVLKKADCDVYFRVLWLKPKEDSIYLINLDGLNMPFHEDYSKVCEDIRNRELVISEYDPLRKLVSEDGISKEAQTFRDEAWNSISEIALNEPEIYIKPLRNAMISKLPQACKRTTKRRLMKFWLYGKCKNSLLPDFKNRGGFGVDHLASEAKRGRPNKYHSRCWNVTDADKKKIAAGGKKYYCTKKELSMQTAYEMMLEDYYSVSLKGTNGRAIRDQNDIYPSYRQFCYWMQKLCDPTATLLSRKGEDEYNAKYRPITGKADECVNSPGERYEIDATIADIYLRSMLNPALLVGRPVIYFVMDTFSHMCVGIYICLTGPSWEGARMALHNAIFDKVNYCAKYGITISADEWPCQDVPVSLRADGGEVKSKAAANFINWLNVRIENTPPFRGDMKGIVERRFRILNQAAVSRLPGHVKTDLSGRTGTSYIDDARLNINDFTKIIIDMVITFNNTQILHKHHLRPQMIEDGIVPKPLDMWNWGVQNAPPVLRKMRSDTVMLSLLPVGEASVSGAGISFKSLMYNGEYGHQIGWFRYARRHKSFKIDVSYDPSDMSKIYYLPERDADFVTFALSTQFTAFNGCSEDEVCTYDEFAASQIAAELPNAVQAKVTFTHNTNETVDGAQKAFDSADKTESKAQSRKRITSNRRKENQAIATNKVREESQAAASDEQSSRASEDNRTVATPNGDGAPTISAFAMLLDEELDEYN
jgi:hypothetical protein